MEWVLEEGLMQGARVEGWEDSALLWGKAQGLLGLVGLLSQGSWARAPPGAGTVCWVLEKVSIARVWGNWSFSFGYEHF